MKESDEERIREIIKEELEAYTEETKDLINQMFEDEMEGLKQEIIKESTDLVYDEIKSELPIIEVLEEHFKLRNGTLYLEDTRIEN